MKGARALLAFQGVEETSESLLGALMTAEYQTMVVKFIEGYAKANAKK